MWALESSGSVPKRVPGRSRMGRDAGQSNLLGTVDDDETADERLKAEAQDTGKDPLSTR